MFLTCDQNRLPAGPGLTGAGAAIWAVAEMWGGGDVLLVQFAATRRGVPRVAMVGLASGGAATLMQLESEGQVVRGAAVLSAGAHRDAGQWTLEPLSEIHLGATRAFDDQRPLVSFARFTTAGGREFSLPIGVAEKYSRGRRLYRSRPAGSPETVPSRAAHVTHPA